MFGPNRDMALYTGLGATDYSSEAESAAFKKLHNLNVAITQLKAQGNTYGVQQLLPYFRQALDEYKRIGNADPAYLTENEQFLLSLGNVAQGAGKLLGVVSDKLIVAGAIVALILIFKDRR